MEYVITVAIRLRVGSTRGFHPPQPIGVEIGLDLPHVKVRKRLHQCFVAFRIARTNVNDLLVFDLGAIRYPFLAETMARRIFHEQQMLSWNLVEDCGDVIPQPARWIERLPDGRKMTQCTRKNRLSGAPHRAQKYCGAESGHDRARDRKPCSLLPPPDAQMPPA